MVGDLKKVLHQLVPALKKSTHTEWLRRIEHLKAEHPSLMIRETDELLGQHVVKAIADATDGGAHIVTGVGQHQLWAAQYSTSDQPTRFPTRSALGTMGRRVPAAAWAG